MEYREHQYTYEEFLTLLARNGTNLYGYLIDERRGIFSDALAREHGVQTTVDNMPEWMVAQGRVAPESVDAWLGLFAAFDRGELCTSAMVSFRSVDGSFGRYWLRADVMTDEDGHPQLAVITFDDFTAISQQFRTKDNDINGLLQATQKVFPEILTLNLTKDTYRMIQYDGATTLGTPKEGAIDDMINIRLGGVVEEDRESFANMFSGERLRAAFEREGREQLQLVYRRPGGDGSVYWFETTVMRQSNPYDDDLLLVAMSRSVNAQKAEESRLREELRLQAEELRLTTSRMGKVLCRYDILSSDMTIPASMTALMALPGVLHNFPEDFIRSRPQPFPPDSLTTLQAFFDTIRSGEPSGSCEYAFLQRGGEERWERMEFASIFDGQGRPLRAVIAVEDVTDQHNQSAENTRLKENERVLQALAQHSDRTVLQYDIQTSIVQFWHKDSEFAYLDGQSIDAVFAFLPPESRAKAEQFFQNVKNGTPGGADKLQIINRHGERRWLDIKYSALTDDEKTPTAILFSFVDITEQYEHELAYRRYVQSLEHDRAEHLLVIESDLTADRVDKLGGQMLPPEEQTVDCSHSDFGRRLLDQKFLHENMEESSQYFSIDNLLRLYAQGERNLQSEWQVRFHDGSLHWLDTEVVLMADPYTEHIKGFFRMMDITEEKETQLAVRRRSERDGMTDLLNRATAEERIRTAIAEKKPGILVLLDLDDLKGINDTFGHGEGDRAIQGVADALKSHFRENDIIGRIGGDEFIVYLSGAAEYRDAIAASIATLLRKLAGIAIGGNDERRIHCSVGCTVQTGKANVFETLYRQADTALYHVKRSGKNSFAFYTPEMEQEDYRFQAQKLFSLQTARKFELAELEQLLDAIAIFYPLVLSVNLSSNNYFLMEEVGGEAFSRVPPFGRLDDFVEMILPMVHPSDAADFRGQLSRAALLEAYRRGEKNVRCYFRLDGTEGYQWMEAAAIFYTNERGDVCEFTLLRRADERAQELEQVWLQKVLELAVVSSFEYICLINTESGEYFLYGDEKNTHDVPRRGSFAAVTQNICDNFIAPEERADYYENARLETVVARMQAQDGSYSYRYTMPDGQREASFYWFEPTHTQLLMTVQRGR